MLDWERGPIRDAKSWIDRATDAIAKSSVEDVADMIWSRLSRREKTGMLPPLVPREETTDVFVQVFAYGGRKVAQEKLSKAVAQLCERSAEAAEDPLVTAEICFLAARLGVTASIPALCRIATRPDAHVEVLHKETLRVRAIRSAVGIAGAETHRGAIPIDLLRPLLEKSLVESGSQLIALTGLVGLDPSHREEYLGRIPGRNAEIERQLDLGLRIAGFVSPPVS